MAAEGAKYSLPRTAYPEGQVGEGESQEWHVELLLWKGVSNTSEVRDLLLKGGLEVGLLNPAMVASVPVLLAAATKALHAQAYGSLVSHSIYSEIIYNLNPGNNLRQAFARFGMQVPQADGGDVPSVPLLAVLFHCSKTSVAEMDALVQGERVPVEAMEAMRDTEALQKVYDISAEEGAQCSLGESVMTRVAVQGKNLVGDDSNGGSGLAKKRKKQGGNGGGGKKRKKN